MGERTLPDLVRQIACSFELRDGQALMPAERLMAWQAELKQLSPTEAEPIVGGLVVLAVRFARLGGEHATMGVKQLCLLVGAMVGSARVARDRFVRSASAEAIVSVPPTVGPSLVEPS